MLLTCDIGNSQIKTGLFSDNELVETGIFKDPDEITGLYSRHSISVTGISSVVPQLSVRLIKFLNQNKGSYHLVSVDSHLNLKINYKTPLTLGTDRICSAAGALWLNGKMREDEIILTVDFGTATTINTVFFPGSFNGGLIVPGVYMMGEALHSYTAQLPQVNFSDYQDIIGDSTKSSIASGSINATLGMIERVIKKLSQTYNTQKIKIYLTGGNAEGVIPYIDFRFKHEKHLVLYGIKAITELNLNT